MTSKTPKELAEVTAAAALESLQAALKVETELRAKVREAQREGWDGLVEPLQSEASEAEDRSDAAFAAWRKAQEAVPHSDRSSE